MPVFLVEALKLIHKNREAIGIESKNTFLFPNPFTLGFKDPYPLIRRYANQFDLAKPDAIISTRLRHNLTTSMQMVNLQPTDMRFIADHLGHSLGINEMYYRKSEEVVELTKMAAALEVAEKGALKQYKGKNFSDLQLDPFDVEPEDPDEPHEAIDSDAGEDPYEESSDDEEEPQPK